MPGKGAEGGAFVDDKKGKDCKGGRMEGWNFARSSYFRETEFSRPYGWSDERDAKKSVSNNFTHIFSPQLGENSHMKYT